MGYFSYVGTLVEINSENSSVALENVTSFGTEDRKQGDEAVGPSNRLYEYIVFRGSDVKDLRIEEQRKEEPPAPPQMPNDPAILGVSLFPKFLVAFSYWYDEEFSDVKLQYTTESAKPCGYFRCLPSDLLAS
jgi:hypothetical protein